MASNLTIQSVIDRISAGDIRIPAFQRDFVWEPEQVAFLLDSIYKGFPIGTIILWKTDKKLSSEKNLGYFELPEPRKDYPVNYILDGQQRLTSLFSVFQTKLTPTTNQWVDIYFDLKAFDSIQDSAFLALDSSEIDLKRHFPVKTFFDSVEYRQATNILESNDQIKIDSVQRKFLTYIIPDIVFEADDMKNVAIVFERINRAGTELNIFELLSAWSWSESFDLVDKFDELQSEIAEHGYEDLTSDRDLQLRITAGIIKQDTSPSTILDLNGEDIRNSFPIIRNGIIGAIDFLKRELNVVHFKMLPFPGIIVPLSVFFATDKANGINYTALQKQKINKWFWRSLFTRRFSAGVNDRQTADIKELINLRNDENYDFKFPHSDIKFEFDKVLFSQGSANSKTLICMLNTLMPKSLISGANIDLAKVLKKGSKHEYHHIFPNKYLQREGYDKKEINVLANFCFLTRSDNVGISDSSPVDYNNRINLDNREDYLNSALIPLNFNQITYEEFISTRTSLLIAEANKLMQ